MDNTAVLHPTLLVTSTAQYMLYRSKRACQNFGPSNSLRIADRAPVRLLSTETTRRAYQTRVHPMDQPLRVMIQFERHPAVYIQSRPELLPYPRWMANETGTSNDFPHSPHQLSPKLYPPHY